jgi:NAD(P)-dependent dehydrogenase (short-subunit alcohol dehydrogenase family)
MKSNDFKGKVAFVTGSASGVGRATAIVFAAEGTIVVVVDISEHGSQETTNIIKEAGAG